MWNSKAGCQGGRGGSPTPLPRGLAHAAVTDTSLAERAASPNSVINYCRSYLCQWRQVRGKFNISLFIHLLISPRLARARHCRHRQRREGLSVYRDTWAFKFRGSIAAQRIFFLVSDLDGAWIYTQITGRQVRRILHTVRGKLQLLGSMKKVNMLCSPCF